MIYTMETNPYHALYGKPAYDLYMDGQRLNIVGGETDIAHIIVKLNNLVTLHIKNHKLRKECDLQAATITTLRTQRDGYADNWERAERELEDARQELANTRAELAQLKSVYKLLANSVYGKGTTQDITITPYIDTDSLGVIEGRKPYTEAELFTPSHPSSCQLCGVLVSHTINTARVAHTRWHNDVADL